MLSNEPIFLGIDMGTSSVKAGFVTKNGRGLLQASAEYPTIQGPENQVEQDPRDWWNATTQAVQSLVRQAPQYAQAVCAVSISCHAPTLFGVDQQGQPVGRGMIWMDRRAQSVCQSILSAHEAHIHAYSHNRIDPYYMLSKLVWQRTYAPEQYYKTKCYLQVNGWIVYRLTGTLVMDVTNANLTQLMNVDTLAWDEEIFDRLGLDLGKMPPIVPCSHMVGTILPEMALLWGISPQAAVSAGCVDGSAAPFGLGLNQEGDVFEMSGTSSGIGVIMSSPRFCPNLSLMKHTQPGKWFLKGSTSSSGGSLKWYRDHVDQCARPDCFETYSELAAQSVPGANGVLFLPYLNGERAPLWDSNLQGVCLGFTSATEKKDLLRAILEGTAYALRTILEEFPPDLRQAPVISGTGGGYKSTIWSQIKADVLERPIQLIKSDFDAAVLGSAYVAMESVGVSAPTTTTQQPDTTFLPNPATAAVYRKQYNRFCRLYQVTRELFHDEGDAPC